MSVLSLAVARMCYKNIVSGSTVFLDSGLTEAFFTVVEYYCQCTAYFSNGGLYSISAVTVPGVAGCAASIDLTSDQGEWLGLAVSCEYAIGEIDFLNTTEDNRVDAVFLSNPPARNINYCLRFDVTPNAGNYFNFIFKCYVSLCCSEMQ